MGYSIIHHQRIATLIYFFHSGISVPYSVFFYLTQQQFNPIPPARNMLPSVANTFRGRANALFIGFLGIHSSILYPIPCPSGILCGSSRVHKISLQTLLSCLPALMPVPFQSRPIQKCGGRS